MPKNLTDRWLEEAFNWRSASGNLDVANLLAAWFSNEAWRRDALGLPASERRTWLAGMGHHFFDSNIGNFADELMWNLSLVEWIWPPPQLRGLARNHAGHLFSSLSDSLDFMSGTPDLASVEYVNRHFLNQAQANPKGTILVGAFQSHPGFLLSTPDLSINKVAVVRKSSATDQASLTLAGIDHVEELPASARAVPRMLDLLDQGQVVALYGDYLFAGSTPIQSALFGYRINLSRSLIRIAIRSGAALVPFAIARMSAGTRSPVVVEFFPPIDATGDDDNMLALKLGVALECLIRQYPAQWRLWNTLRNRCY